MTYRRTALVLAAIAVAVALVPPVVDAHGAPAGSAPVLGGTAGTIPPIFAASAILMDARTGAVLYAQAADARRPPASTTKILTAIIVLEYLRPDTMVPISKRAAEQRSGSAIGLEVGERWRADDLLNALILASANDAAVALAEAVAGSVERFADLMNQKARAIGARDSTFVVPHGLYYPQHLTTARDLALITRYALRHPAFAALVRQQTFTWMRHGLPPRVVVNRNRLLWRLPGADGVKTGWIPESGQCLVASATRGGWQLIAVALDSPDVFADATRLLEYGFSHFRLVRVAAREVVLARRPLPRADKLVSAAVPEDVYVVLPRGAALHWEVRLPPDLLPPIRRGMPIGELMVYADGRLVARQPVVAAEDVEARSLWRHVLAWVRGLITRSTAAGHGG
ncbi:MAG: serine-type D-Ala-D-Ala carboxypeptidase [Armatimonadetes bacterium CSP1-3]|nr:MAG: serine-type D-Ala-D-Ala carboxypeptidase [Armatimonadetes bacterium CSP1-3]